MLKEFCFLPRHFLYSIGETVALHLIHKWVWLEGLRAKHTHSFPLTVVKQIHGNHGTKRGLRDNRLAAPPPHTFLVIRYLIDINFAWPSGFPTFYPGTCA